MAVGLLQLDFELAGTALIAGLQPMSTFWGKQNFRFVQGLFENGRHVAEMCRGRRQASVDERMTPEEFFLDPTYWWDNSRGKKIFGPPDFRPKKSKDSLCNPAWVDSQVAMWDVEMRKPPGSVATAVQGRSGKAEPFEDDSQVATCSRLCEEGRVIEAVDRLNLLMQRGYPIPRNLFYRLLKRCMAQRDLVVGRRVHALIITSRYKSDAFFANHLICMYASHGSLVDAMQVFSKVPEPDAYMWASIILAYAKLGQPSQAIGLYKQMLESTVKPDNCIFVAVLKACATAADLGAGKDVHAHILNSAGKPNISVHNSLVNMYSKCGSLEDARRVFDSVSQKNMVTWTAMIAGYAQQGMGQEALRLYSDMQQEDLPPPDSVTLVCLLQACASVGVAGVHHGKQIHAQIEEQGLQDHVIVGASLVNMYAKCGSIEDAQRVFDRLPQKDVVIWTAMIAGYAQKGMGQEALSLYTNMQQEGITPPNTVTFVCLLQACASVAALPLGKQLHARIKERRLQSDMLVGPSLVNMYAKCGSLEDARQVFDTLPEREIVAWSALIAGYARQGDSEVVFDLLHRMREAGIKPNGIMCLSVLTLCSHGGFVDKGRKYFEAMTTDYGINPTIEHYTCMVDLLGRAGHLNEALQMVKTMPFQPDATVWLTLLGTCRKWNNVEVGRHAFESAVRLDEKDAAAYILMSNIYAGAEMWEEAKEMQARRVKSGAWKEPGQSWWTDMEGVMHSFVVGDGKHSESQGM